MPFKFSAYFISLFPGAEIIRMLIPFVNLSFVGYRLSPDFLSELEKGVQKA